MLYGNVGLQYVDVDQQSSGFGTYTGPDLYVLATPIVDGADYSDWLPSLNMTYDFGNNHLLRFAASKTVSRPRMDDMRSNQQVSFGFNVSSIDSTDPRNGPWSGSAGNARLNPLEANQFDLAWDWYFADDGIVSAAYFYKDLMNWHRAGQFIADFSQFYIPGYHQVIDADGVVHIPADLRRPGQLPRGRSDGRRQRHRVADDLPVPHPVGAAGWPGRDRDGHVHRRRTRRRHGRAGPVGRELLDDPVLRESAASKPASRGPSAPST